MTGAGCGGGDSTTSTESEGGGHPASPGPESGGIGDLNVAVAERLHPSGGKDEYDGLLELTLARIGEVKPIPTPPPSRPMEALTKKLGAARTRELEAGVRGLVSLTWAAIGR